MVGWTGSADPSEAGREARRSRGPGSVPVPVVSRLLGHSNVRMTLRYAHLGDREIEAAAERIGQSIGAIMGL